MTPTRTVLALFALGALAGALAAELRRARWEIRQLEGEIQYFPPGALDAGVPR